MEDAPGILGIRTRILAFKLGTRTPV